MGVVFPATLFKSESVHARMTGVDELSISVLIDYPIGKRWTIIYKGKPGGDVLRALLMQLETMTETVRELLPAAPVDTEERWYEGMYESHG